MMEITGVGIDGGLMLPKDAAWLPFASQEVSSYSSLFV